MLFRDRNGKLIEITRGMYHNDNFYYSKMMSIKQKHLIKQEKSVEHTGNQKYKIFQII